MPDETPSLEMLLSSRATVLHQTRRPYIEKRVVELDGNGYVLHRFPSRAVLVEFEQTLCKARAEGTALQGVLLSTADIEDAPGFWLVLNCLPGELMSRRRFDSKTLESLATNVASLHRVHASQARPLLLRDMDQVPYHDFLDEHDLSLAERQWVAASAERFYGIDRFQLSHGDLHGRNILVGPDKQAALIDYELLAFEPAGLELATMLLRSYCRSPQHRRVFLKAYVAKSRKADLAFWKAHAADLLLAASLRLTWLRRRRLSILLRRRWLFVVLLRLAVSPARRKRLSEQFELIEAQLAHAQKGLTTYSALSRYLLRAAMENPGASSHALISTSYAAMKQARAVSAEK